MEPMQKPIVIATFYHFASLPDYEAMRQPLLRFCNQHKLKGTILLAEEGLNSTISGSRTSIDALMGYLKSDARLASLTHKESFHDIQPFQRMKVRLKKEIVRLGVEDLNIDNRGIYINPKDWDKLISDPDVVVVDTRNDYEVHVGTFEGAVNPNTKNFRDLPAWVQQNLHPDKHKKVAMFCTGGIRCEKSTALMKHFGFDEVYHLQGGILKYFEDTQNANGKWKGDCFVFDDRVAVNAHLQPSGAVICPSCNIPFTTDDLKLGQGEYGVRCAACAEK